jgi:hypothetical protein
VGPRGTEYFLGWFDSDVEAREGRRARCTGGLPWR